MKSIAVVALCMFAAAAGEAEASADAGYLYGPMDMDTILPTMVTMDTLMPTIMDITMARGLLMPSLRPMLVFCMVTMDTDTILAMPTMDTMDTHMPTTTDTSMAR